MNFSPCVEVLYLQNLNTFFSILKRHDVHLIVMNTGRNNKYTGISHINIEIFIKLVHTIYLYDLINILVFNGPAHLELSIVYQTESNSKFGKAFESL